MPFKNSAFHVGPKLSGWATELYLEDQEFVIDSHLPQFPVVQNAALTALRVDQIEFPWKAFCNSF